MAVDIALDGQINRSLTKPKSFNAFNVKGLKPAYILHTVGLTEMTGKKAIDFVVQLIYF